MSDDHRPVTEEEARTRQADDLDEGDAEEAPEDDEE